LFSEGPNELALCPSCASLIVSSEDILPRLLKREWRSLRMREGGLKGVVTSLKRAGERKGMAQERVERRIRSLGERAKLLRCLLSTYKEKEVKK